MKQKIINKNVDYFNRAIKDENYPQNNRMTWILASQALLFAGICEIISQVRMEEKEHMIKNIIGILCLVGLFLSLSAIYSMLVGELSVGNIMHNWNRYNQTRKKPMDVPHLVIAVPNSVLRSKLKFLSLYSFAPKVFCTAWIVVLILLLSNFIYYLNMNVSATILLFIVILIVLVITGTCLYNYYQLCENISHIANDIQDIKEFNKKLSEQNKKLQKKTGKQKSTENTNNEEQN